MQLEIQLKKEMQKLQRELGNLKNKQLPQAYAKALNEVALAARPVLMNEFQGSLNISRKSMMNKAVQINFANKLQFPYLEAELGIITEFGFLVDHVEGVVRKAANQHGKAIPQKDVKRSGSGGISKAQRPGALLRKKGVFIIQTKSGKEAIAMKDKKSGEMKFLYSFAPQVQIDKRVVFENSINSLVNSKFDRIFGQQLAKAIASAK